MLVCLILWFSVHSVIECSWNVKKTLKTNMNKSCKKGIKIRARSPFDFVEICWWCFRPSFCPTKWLKNQPLKKTREVQFMLPKLKMIEFSPYVLPRRFFFVLIVFATPDLQNRMNRWGIGTGFSKKDKTLKTSMDFVHVFWCPSVQPLWIAEESGPTTSEIIKIGD